MILALDTNVIIDLVRGKAPAVRDRFNAALAAEQPMVASLIVLHELHFGCALHRDPAGELARVRVLLSRLEVEPLDEADMSSAARIRAALRGRGLTIGPYDALIAGQALARGWTVVTANTREFARIGGLNVIDWTAPAD
ncbi:MAG TPA: type II toxin-antitoxin system VapC family toxin [Caulobacteraceae bacterium]|nr:type II toxin-antitoxin system VapC family toxin [Caulobacteraceae bacterium]